MQITRFISLTAFLLSLAPRPASALPTGDLSFSNATGEALSSSSSSSSSAHGSIEPRRPSKISGNTGFRYCKRAENGAIVVDDFSFSPHHKPLRGKTTTVSFSLTSHIFVAKPAIEWLYTYEWYDRPGNLRQKVIDMCSQWEIGCDGLKPGDSVSGEYDVHIPWYWQEDRHSFLGEVDLFDQATMERLGCIEGEFRVKDD